MLAQIYLLLVIISYSACKFSHHHLIDDPSGLERFTDAASHESRLAGPSDAHDYEDDNPRSWGSGLALGFGSLNAHDQKKSEIHTPVTPHTNQDLFDDPSHYSIVNGDEPLARDGIKKRKKMESGFLQQSPAEYRVYGEVPEHDPFGGGDYASVWTTNQGHSQNKKMKSIIEKNAEAQRRLIGLGRPPPLVAEGPGATMLAQRNNGSKLPNHQNPHLDNDENQVHQSRSTGISAATSLIPSGPLVQRKKI